MNEDDPLESGYDEEIVKNLISSEWEPELSGDLVSHDEILEFINKVEPISGHALFKILLDLKFSYTRIENNLYWKVKAA